MSFSTVTVNVCAWLISCVPLAAIDILASTHVVVDAALLAPDPSVTRLSDTPLTVPLQCADTFVMPVAAESICTVQLPAVVVHELGPTKPPGPLSFVKVIVVPSARWQSRCRR